MSFAINQGLFLLEITDYYAVLGLPIDADPKTVRIAYLKIAQRLHPDTCKIENAQEKQLAKELLSKLVNPAYEKLAKKNSWSEYQLILRQLGKQLGNPTEKPPKLTSPLAQELYQKSNVEDIEEAYRRILQGLASQAYEVIPKTLSVIGQLSELNLVYLRSLHKREESESADMATAKSTDSFLDGAIRRAEEYLKGQNYAKAILELRDAIKIDPNNAHAHALMGTVYLKQNQLAMAKVHIKKAYLAKASDPLVQQAKKALEKATGSPLDIQSGKEKPKDSGKSGLFGGLFGGKKK